MAHARRKFFDSHLANNSQLAEQALHSIVSVWSIHLGIALIPVLALLGSLHKGLDFLILTPSSALSSCQGKAHNFTPDDLHLALLEGNDANAKLSP